MEPDTEMVEAQMAGEPIFEESRGTFEQELSRLVNIHSAEVNTPDFLLARFLEGARRLFVETTDTRDRWKHDNSSENFGFYVDGYTLKGTDTIGEILVTAYDGRTITMKSAALVAFLERRLTPPNINTEN